MKAFVTGVAGQLGYDVVKELLKRGYTVVGSDITENETNKVTEAMVGNGASYEFVLLDITKQASVEKELSRVCPEVVVHCAAWTAVDLAEDEDKQERYGR